ncbi:hypothetical protein [Marinimicrobium alkaliphilum]|uniref:hypothetical protein n=1 Tax=Marinimicrobium alkaliphilum TaxID=2202654 RepID=UPI000DB9932C|nr:hypothetical protein [Marinimicrobium alkaliphilum]
MTRTLFLLAGLCLALVAGCATQPSAVTPNTPAHLTLADETLTLDIVIERPGAYVIETQSDLDTVCRLLDASGEQLASDDDSGANYNCLMFAALEPGHYSAQVWGYDSDTDRGPVTLRVFEPRTPDLTLDTPTSVDLMDTQTRFFRLHVDTAGHYQVSTRGELDTFCYLYDAEGGWIAYNDDIGEDLNCTVAANLAPGDYLARVSAFDPGRSRVIFEPQQAEQRSIRVGRTMPLHFPLPFGLVDLTVDIWEDGEHRFYTSGSTDTVCEVYSEDGERLAENDDDFDLNCGMTLDLEAGRYRFRIWSYEGATGQFSAHVREVQ